MTRAGVPDGYGGRREELNAAHAEAQHKADRAYERFRQRNWLDWDAMGEAALTQLIAISLNPIVKVRDRIAATRVVLEYCRVKPARGTRQGRNIAEWLEDLVEAEEAFCVLKKPSCAT